jgi:uncharacterized protein YjdB
MSNYYQSVINAAFNRPMDYGNGASGAPTLVSIDVTPNAPTINLGTTQQFTATGTYSDASTANITGSVTWSSGTPITATIDSAGLATSVGHGTTIITATQGVISGSETLTVNRVLSSIDVTPNTPSVTVGATQQMTATATFNDATTSDVTATATWASTNSGQATVNSTGLVTGVAIGTPSISATVGAVSGNETVTVTAAGRATIVTTNLEAGASTTNGTVFNTTGTFTVASGETIFLETMATTAAETPTVACPSAGGVVWNAVANAQVGVRRISRFYAVGPWTSEIRMTYATTQSSALWVVDKLTGVAASGPVVQTLNANDTAGTNTQIPTPPTLAAFEHANNVNRTSYGFSAAGTITWNNGLTGTGQVNITANVGTLGTARAANVQTSSPASSVASNLVILVSEIKSA